MLKFNGRLFLEAYSHFVSTFKLNSMMNVVYGFDGNPYYIWHYEVGEMARQGAIGVEELIRNKVNQIRRWKLTALGKRRPKTGFQFTVMTYNILSQAAVDCHMYLYRKCSPQHISEEYRISRILPEILRSGSDVVCLQEVEQHLYEGRIRAALDSGGFGSVFKRRTGNKSDGCAILWRRAKFILVGHQEVEFRSRGCEVLDRDNVGLIAVLRPRHPAAGHHRLHVATTHLLYNPRRGDVKLCQLRLLLAELERSALRGTGQGGDREYHPAVLCGDFNVEPHSPLYRFLESGRLDVSGLVAGNMSGQHEGKDKGGYVDGNRLSLDRLGIDESGRFAPTAGGGKHSSSAPTKSGESSGLRQLNSMMDASRLQQLDGDSDSDTSEPGTSQLFYHDFNFVPAYKFHQRDRKAMPVTSMTGDECNTVDHIFYTVRRKSSPTSYEEGSLKLLGIYTLPRVDQLRDLEGLPNAHLGSDHLCLMSKFIIA